MLYCFFKYQANLGDCFEADYVFPNYHRWLTDEQRKECFHLPIILHYNRQPQIRV